MATDLDAQYAALDKQVAAARANVRVEFEAGRQEAYQKGITGYAATTYARQTPAYQEAKAEQVSLTKQRNAVDNLRNPPPVSTPYGTTQTEYYDPNTGESGTYISRQTPAGDAPVSQTAADVAPSQDPVPQEWSYGPSVTQSNPTQLPDIQLQEPDITPPAPQPSTADQPIPFISDETYLDPLYEPAPTSPTVGNLPTSPYDINRDGTVSDSEYLYGDDELYEPVPTDEELASIQEDIEFGQAELEFANLQTDVEWTEDFYLDNADDLDEIAAKYGVDPTSQQARDIWEQEYGNDPELNFNTGPNDGAGYTQPPPSPKPPRSIHDGRRPIVKEDWRFRIRLSPYSDYLYNGPNPGILAPLKATDGVVFPYMPTITMAQTTDYRQQELPHSNARAYFYSHSKQENIILRGMFTAQDTNEAQYMLAVLHFFRSAGKMFYGQDSRRGTPPPLLYLTGLGEHQFNEHPCLLSTFQYDLPDNVDYIKTSNTPTAQYTPAGRLSPGSGNDSWSSKITRMITSGLEGILSDGLPSIPNFNGAGITKVTDGATYVPTKVNIQMTMLPVNSRQQVSTEYSLRDFANGSLLKKGYW